jgi:stage III sporulation protein AB
MCAIILICTTAIGANIYKNTIFKLRILEAFKNMFYMFEAYITIEHCEIKECLRRYMLKNDANLPILQFLERRMREDKRVGFHRAMEDALADFIKKNPGALERGDAQLILNTCEGIDGLSRSFISGFLEKSGQLLDRRIGECREKDVKNGRLFNQIGVLVGIAIIILII